MTETVKLRLERSGPETAINAVVAIASTVMVYYSLHPDVAERHSEQVKVFCQKFLYRLSVGQAISAIRSLPETPDDL